MENDSEPQGNIGGNFVVIETHLQVSNLIKILLTIPYDVLRLSVENIPEEVKDTQHAKVLTTVLDFYTNIANLSQTQAPQAEKEEAVPAQEDADESDGVDPSQR